MADKRKAEEEKKQYAKRQKTEMGAQNPLSQKPAAAPQKSTNIFQNLFAGLLGRQKKQELVVAQQKDLSKQQSTSADIIGDVTSAAMTAKTAQVVADGSVKQETVTAKENLTVKDGVTTEKSATKSTSVAKGQTAPMAAQELQSKQGVKLADKAKQTTKLSATKKQQGQLTTQQQLTAKQQVSKTTGLKQATKATQTVSTTTEVKPGVKQKVATKVVKQKSATVKTTTAQRVSLQQPLTQKEQAAKAAKKAPKGAPQTQSIRMLTNEDGKVTDIFLGRFNTVQTTNRAKAKGQTDYTVGKKTADKISSLKKIIKTKGKEKGEGIKMSR